MKARLDRIVFLTLAVSGCSRAAMTPDVAKPTVPRAVAVAEPAIESAEPPFGIRERTPWTASRVSGSPEPPPPYGIERVFAKLKFQNPVEIVAAPGSDRLFVAELKGKIFSFPNDPECETADVFVDLAKEIQSIDPAGPARGTGDVYGLVFHPDFERNRYCYICYTLESKSSGQQLPEGTRVSRFRVTADDPPRIDPASEKIVITWLSGGHNGGCLRFGPDGCLYISTGDAAPPNPPDPLRCGQDVSNLLSAILRIDVDRGDGDRPYAIPADNPFVSLDGARGEIWAYGFRNPWKMSFDRQTGDLWAGDVGWELWEMIYRVERAGNYGWSIMEGPQPVRVEGERGPTPIRPPTIALAHSEAASITGGYVYRGKRLPDLAGAYIFGDWETRRIWAARWDGERVTSRQEIADPTLRIIAFGEDNDGELLLMDYDDGTIHRLVPNESDGPRPEFPRTLSDTGLFASVADHTPAPGVIPFSINAEQWSDHATAERWLALPGDSSITWHPAPVPVPGTIMQRRLVFPADAVLIKTISIEMERGNPATRRRVETQMLHYNGKNWNAYSYQWNDDQTNAVLVDAAGLDRSFTINDSAARGGQRRTIWNFAGRPACARCHNPWAQHTLAFNMAEINRDHDYGGTIDNQVRTLRHIGVLEFAGPQPGDSSRDSQPAFARLVNPYDASADLDARARSYLQVNCAHCHQPGAGGTAEIDLRFDTTIGETKTLGIRPLQGTFGILDAHILSPGDPFRSVLYYRTAKLGRGRMPLVGSAVVDEAGLRLLHDWIRQLPVRVDEVAIIDRLRACDEATAIEREANETDSRVARLAADEAKKNGREQPTEADRDGARAIDRGQAAERIAARERGRNQAIAELLSTRSRAILLARALAENQLPDGVRSQALAAAIAHADMEIRDLFERFIPDDQRAKRLGNVVKAAEILAIAGDAARGRELFFGSSAAQCKNCHRIDGVGSSLGPDLTAIAKKYSRAQLLEHILEPSKTIDPQFVAYLVETASGRVLTGLVARKDAAEVVLRDARDQEIRLPAAEVLQLRPQSQSLMPELLLRDMSPTQAADLIEFLATLN
jgi:putative heme-binding domain-containing protein